MKQALQKKQRTQPIEGMIRLIRGQKVMLDHDLADIYGVGTKVLNQAVRRNIERFPDDFMFQLSLSETEFLRSQTVTAKIVQKQYITSMRSQTVTATKRRSQPLAFTEHGIAMLSSVLRSPRAVQMNILIIRAFVRLRELLATNKEFAVRLEKLERGHEETDSVIEVLIEDIDKLSREIHWMKNPPLKPKRRIGFIVGGEDEG